MAEPEKELESRDDVIEGFDRDIGRAQAILQGRDTDDGDPAEGTPATTPPPEPSTPTEGEEPSPAPADKEPKEAPPAEGEGKEPAEPADKAAEEAPPAEEPATPTPETPSEDDEVVLDTGEEVFTLGDLKDPERRKAYLEKVEEIRKDGLRQSAFTQKTMELADQRRGLEEQTRLREKVVEKILTDPQALEYVQAHGRLALRALLADPKSGLAVLDDPDQLQRLWKQSDAIAQNPGLADQLVSRHEADRAKAELQARTEQDELVTLARTIHTAVDEIAADYPNVDKEDVSRLLWAMGGLDVTKVKEGDQESWWNALRRLQSTLEIRQVEADPDGRQRVARYLDEKVIRGQFDALSKYAARKESKEDEELERHNQATDQALATKPPPPPPKGGPAAPADGRPKEPQSREEVEDELDQMIANARRTARAGAF